MTIVFLSNFFNHHQSALSDALWRITDGSYVFVETGKIPRERKLLGYEAASRPYLLRLKGNRGKVIQLVRSADVVIAGAAPEWLVQHRIREEKLLFRYEERQLKQGEEPGKFLIRQIKWRSRNPSGNPVYILCASAYAAGDYAKFGLFHHRMYQWGYFPEMKQYPDPDALVAAKNTSHILWCGRFLDWKHPEAAVYAAHWLKKEGFAVTMNFIGRGPMEGTLRKLVQKYRLEETVHFLGTMPPEEVRAYMEQAGIFLFTSGRQEGWGAVVNEAMNSACAVIASHAAGAVPCLVKDGENGLIYESEKEIQLCEKLRYLLLHPREQRRLGRKAQETIADQWNAEEAAQRLISLAQAILAGEKQPQLYDSGPCSTAEVLDDRWKP